MHPELLNSLPPAPNSIIPWSAGPRRRTLAVLAVLAVLAHALVLQTRPERFGPAAQPAAGRAPAFVTRSLPPPAPPAMPAPAGQPEPAPAPVAKPAKKPVFKQKVPVPQVLPALPAIDSIAEPLPAPGSADAAAVPAEPDSPSPPAADMAPAPSAAADNDTATAALPAASAAAALAPPPEPAGTPVTAMALPASARLAYRMNGSAKGLTYHAKGEMLWENAGSSYHARMTVKALFLGARTLSSTGQLSAQGLAPSRFADKSKTEVAAHFEPDKGQISFSANRPAVAWVPGVQDRVSVLMQLGGMLAGNPAGFPVGSTISMLTVGPRDADPWTFAVESEEQLSLPFGELATLKLSRQPRREYDQKVEVWYAPALGYLPVRNKITQANGDFVDQQLSELGSP